MKQETKIGVLIQTRFRAGIVCKLSVKYLSVILLLLLLLLMFSCAPPPKPVQPPAFRPPVQWESINKSESEVRLYLDLNKNNLNPIEGIWNINEITIKTLGTASRRTENNNMYRIAIIKDTISTNFDFIAFVLETKSPEWAPGRIKAKFRKTAYQSLYDGLWYMKNYAPHTDNYTIDEFGFMKQSSSEYRDYFNVITEKIFIKAYPFITARPDSDVASGSEVKSTGSGFLISQNGLIITNYHVVENAEEIEISFPNRNITKHATLRLKDIKNDLAILEIDNFDFNEISKTQIPYSLADIESVKVGQEVFTLGFPLGSIMGSKARLATGRINSVYGLQDDPRLLQIGNPLSPGNSGGPLFNVKGELVGVVVSGLNAKYFYDNLGIIPQNINFAVKINYLQNVLKMLPENDDIVNRQSIISGLPMEEQIEKLSFFIVQIHVK